MNQYLEVLGLQPGVNEKEVKEAYRKLVKKYHPDVNKAPDAAKKFIEVSEAYKFLMDVGARPHQEPIAYDYNPYEREYEEWRQRAREYARKKKEETEANYRRILLKIFKYFDYVAYVVLFINILWAIDYILPYKYSEEKFMFVEKYFMSQGRSGITSYTYDILHFENHKILVEKNLLNEIKDFDGVGIVYSTLIFNTVIKIGFSSFQNNLFVYPAYSIYRFFGFLTPLIFLISAAYFKWTQVLENKFTWALLIVLVFFLQLKIM